MAVRTAKSLRGLHVGRNGEECACGRAYGRCRTVTPWGGALWSSVQVAACCWQAPWCLPYHGTHTPRTAVATREALHLLVM